MTDTTLDAGTDRDLAAEWPRRGRPVRWLALAIVLTGALSVGAIWTGAIAPQVHIGPPGDGPTAWDGAVLVSLRVENLAAVDTRMLDAGTSGPGLDLVGVGVAPAGDSVSLSDIGPIEPGPGAPEPGDHLPADGVDVGGGDAVHVILRYAVTDCRRAAQAELPVPVTFRTPLGISRTVDATDDIWLGALPTLVATACESPTPA